MRMEREQHNEKLKGSDEQATNPRKNMQHRSNGTEKERETDIRLPTQKPRKNVTTRN